MTVVAESRSAWFMGHSYTISACTPGTLVMCSTQCFSNRPLAATSCVPGACVLGPTMMRTRAAGALKTAGAPANPNVMANMARGKFMG